jgi:hypothetical protein
MRTRSQSARAAFVMAGLSLVVAVATGVAWLGQPLKLVHLVTIIGLSLTAGVSWAKAVWRARQERAAD